MPSRLQLNIKGWLEGREISEGGQAGRQPGRKCHPDLGLRQTPGRPSLARAQTLRDAVAVHLVEPPGPRRRRNSPTFPLRGAQSLRRPSRQQKPLTHTPPCPFARGGGRVRRGRGLGIARAAREGRYARKYYEVSRLQRGGAGVAR